MKAAIIDYGMGNLGSVRRAFEECGADVFISEYPDELRTATHIILPGVGAFADGMEQLHNRGWIPAIQEQVKQNVPLLGICLGMQLLADQGVEGGIVPGLGLIPGTVERLKASVPSERIPHVGWNELHSAYPDALLEGIPNGTDYYFVHSYHFQTAEQEHILATTPFCGGFVSAVKSGAVYGVQFHPEKSQRSGFRLIQNFLKL